MWQDTVISIICYGFALALIPSIKSRHKPSRWSSILTGSGLIVVATCFATLGLWQSFAADMCGAAMWFILLYQVVSKKGG